MTRWSTACIFPDGNEHRRCKRFDLGKEKLPRSPTPFPNVSLVSAFLLSGVGKPLDLHITNVRMAECPRSSFSSLFGFAKKNWLPLFNRASKHLAPRKHGTQQTAREWCAKCSLAACQADHEQGVPSCLESEMLLLPGEHPCSFQSLPFRTDTS